MMELQTAPSVKCPKSTMVVLTSQYSLRSNSPSLVSDNNLLQIFIQMNQIQGDMNSCVDNVTDSLNVVTRKFACFCNFDG